MSATSTPIRPTPRPAPVPVVPRPPAAAQCGVCNGDGGSWVTNDGQTPGKNIREWVPCTNCKGRGTV